MLIVRFRAGDATRYGALEGPVVLEYSGRPTRAKGFDTFCPLGPCIATDLDPSALSVEGLVARVSEIMTLVPGDVIATGTPAGADRLLPGDRVEVRVEGVGSLKNPVVKL